MSSAKSQSERLRILFMDDEPDIRRVGFRVLQHLGYDAEVVSNGDEAIQSCEKAQTEGKPFAVAILDITIVGGMGGIETMSRLRAIDPEIKVIISSGYSNEEVREKLADGTCAASMAKPYEIATMAATIGKVLGPCT